MKPLKSAEQKNVKLNRDFYTVAKIRQLVESKNVAVMDWENFKQLSLNDLDFMYDSLDALKNYGLVIFLENAKEIKVAYNKDFEMYYNIVTMNDGTEIVVEL